MFPAQFAEELLHSLCVEHIFLRIKSSFKHLFFPTHQRNIVIFGSMQTSLKILWENVFVKNVCYMARQPYFAHKIWNKF